MAMTSRIRDLTLDRAPASEIKKAAIADGMLTLRRDGLEKMKRGLTTAQEILKESATDEV
jgi:type IV pilus assembly protein PilB